MPKKTQIQAVGNDSGKTPFDQITDLEHQSEKKITSVLQKIEEKEMEVEKSIKIMKNEEEEKIDEKAREELIEYTKTEPAAILSKTEAALREDVAHIESYWKKHSEKIAADLANSLIDFTSTIPRS